MHTERTVRWPSRTRKARWSRSTNGCRSAMASRCSMRWLDALEGWRPLEVAVETCPFWPWIYDVLEPTEIGVHLAHASKLEAIAKAETKTDSVDARLLARMLAANLIPEVYPKPASQREIVHLVRHRAALVTERTRLACRIHSHLHQQGLELSREKLLARQGRRWLRREAWTWLSVEQRALVETHLEQIDTLNPQIDELDDRIQARSREHAGASLLQTIPGIGPYRSLLLAGEILPISRFPSPEHLVSTRGWRPAPGARAERPGTGARRKQPIGGCEGPWCRRFRATCARRRTAPWAPTTNARRNESGGRRPVWLPPENCAGPSTPCSPQARYGAAEPGRHPTDRGELVRTHAASTAFTGLTGPPPA